MLLNHGYIMAAEVVDSDQSIRKEVSIDNTIFSAGEKPIPTLAEKPLRSLGRQYKAGQTDR